ncbi:phospholipase A2 inhibitor gamma subunit B-like isoform X1 [Varanus komodoensis]|uniref:Phospholipase A2 inhibitor N-terminal domain-containing protein n=1 Tax=Varanus komodoensis TaxID=61221 RepID=A0A8D2J7Q4_VARKO|nr:phospholipase A2 inhibitor gamma subunit B-like isoform X1 [Varanus komodoensis]
MGCQNSFGCEKEEFPKAVQTAGIASSETEVLSPGLHSAFPPIVMTVVIAFLRPFLFFELLRAAQLSALEAHTVKPTLPTTASDVEAGGPWETSQPMFSTHAEISPGAFLECETCFATDSSCEGVMERCDDGEDTCAIFLHEMSEGEETRLRFAKGCYASQYCGSRPVFVTFGKGKFIRRNIVCCQSNDCPLASPRVSPWNTTANGKRCPGCYSQSHPCPAGEVNCTGAEDYCLNLMGLNDAGKTTIVRGCTTQPICAGLQSGQLDLQAFEVEEASVECRRAGQTPLLPQSLLLALSCLLLTEVLL